MQKREFNSLMKFVAPKGVLDKSRVAEMGGPTKLAIVRHLVRHRKPIVKDFLKGILSAELNSWLHCCGWSYDFHKNGLIWRGTAAHHLHETKKIP